MVFNSIAFFVFLVLVFFLFWKIVSISNKSGRLVLLLASYVFYGWWDWRFLILIIISSLTDFIIGKKIHLGKTEKIRNLLLALSIIINLGILFFFKYFNFFIDSFEILFGLNSAQNGWSTLNIILPVGISFYTFQTMSYSIDIYRRKMEPTHSALTFFTFVAFFPQLVAGPIERAQNLIPQMEKKFRLDFNQASSGLKLMLWGLFKKMVIADQLAIIVNEIYASPEQFGGTGVIAATFLFGVQIYCDFSGYSDIAIGTARLFGIELMTNFKTPYFAASFREFWRRWHISLSTWFRDYLYIPLGGNRGSSMRWTKNILITFVVSGFWHGASFTFLIWGFLHGLFLVSEHFISEKIRIQNKFKNLSGWLITFLFVNLSWLFFRAESFADAVYLLKTIGGGNAETSKSFLSLITFDGSLTEPGRMLLFVFPFFILIEWIIGKKEFPELLAGSKMWVRWAFYYLVILAILFFGVMKSAPGFIYFQF